jgi:hypothetical protein
MGVDGQHLAPVALPPVKRPRYPLYRRWVGPIAHGDGCEEYQMSCSAGVRIPNGPTRSNSSYRPPLPAVCVCARVKLWYIKQRFANYLCMGLLGALWTLLEQLVDWYL